MGIADELEKLDQLRAKGTLTEEEFAQAKARLLSKPPQTDEAEARNLLEEQLVELRLQNQGAQIAREWEVERQRYLIVNSYGMVYVPSLTMGLTIAIAGSLFGLFWMYTGYSLPAIINSVSPVTWEFPVINKAIFVIGALFVLISLYRGISLSAKAIRYQRALRTYQRKRDQVMK